MFLKQKYTLKSLWESERKAPKKKEKIDFSSTNLKSFFLL